MVSLNLKDSYLRVPIQPQVPEVYGLQQALLVPGSLFWSLHGSTGLHQGYGSGFDDSTPVRYPDPPVLGRLAHPGSVLGASSPSSGDSSLSLSLSRAGHCRQPSEAKPGFFSAGSQFGDGDRLCVFQGFSFPATSREAALNRRGISVLQAVARNPLEGSVGDTLLAVPSCSGRSSPDVVPPADPTPLLGSGGRHCPRPVGRSVPPGSLLVARSRLSPGGRFSEPSLPGPRLLVRRLRRGLGCSPGSGGSFQPVVSGGGLPFHQCQRAFGSGKGSSLSGSRLRFRSRYVR